MSNTTRISGRWPESINLLTANYIAKENTQFSCDLFRFSLLSTLKFCDSVVIVDNGCSKEVLEMIDYIASHIPKPIQVIPYHKECTSFSDLRNVALDNTISKWILWVDTDEVHFDRAFNLRKLVENADPKIMLLNTAFYHFTLDIGHYAAVEPRCNIIRKVDGMRWEGKVHEHIEGLPSDKLTMLTDYRYCHFGYCKPQAEIFDHWKHYAVLEGQKNPYEFEEENGKTVPYFRGDRSGPDKIIEDRRKVLMEYYGEYPEVMGKQWLLEYGVQ